MTETDFKNALNSLIATALSNQYSDPLRRDVWLAIREDLTRAANRFNERDKNFLNN